MAIWEAAVKKVAFVGKEQLLLTIKKENLGTKAEQAQSGTVFPATARSVKADLKCYSLDQYFPVSQQ